MRASTILFLASTAGLVAACGPGREAVYKAPAGPTVATAAPAADAPAAAAVAPAAVEGVAGDATMAHFRCETGELLAVRFDRAGNTATILDPRGDRVLPGEPTGSGFLYQSPFASLRGKGEDLQYAVGRRAASNCVAISPSLHRILSERRAAGAVWRAMGQEPGWSYEVMADGSVEAVLDYGQRRIGASGATRETDGDATRWVSNVGTGAMTMTITRTPCADTMSGERYWFTAALVVDGQTLNGCAQPLG